MNHSTPEAFFLCSILVLFALVVAWGFCKLVVWVWLKCFHDPEDDYEL